jgi:signal transduction histidine kinase
MGDTAPDDLVSRTEAAARRLWCDRYVLRLPRRGTLGRDLALAGVAMVGGLLMLSLGAYRQMQPTFWGVTPVPLFLLPLLVVCVAVALRRVAPRASLAVGVVALLADLALGGSLGTILIFTQVLYDACVYGPPTLWRHALRVSIALAVASAAVGVALARQLNGLALGIPAVLILVLPVVTGLSVRQYRDQADAARAHAEQTARLAELDRRQAVAAERTRMARELHDVVANHLSAVAIHATAALSVRTLKPEQVEEALRVIRENSVQGLAEMRQMIDVLRGPAGEDAPDEPATARLAEIERLADRARGAGLAVALATTGEPRPLPVGVDLAGYRIVQESLTNALRHGAGAATVAVDYHPDRVAITVSNPLPPDGATASTDGAGAGLIGMRERATLVHGKLDAGPYEQGWRVHAELPAVDGAA